MTVGRARIYLLRREPSFEKQKCPKKTKEKGVRTRRAAIVNQSAIVDSLRYA